MTSVTLQTSSILSIHPLQSPMAPSNAIDYVKITEPSPLFGDSPFDAFLMYCYEHGILNKDFTIVNSRGISPPALSDEEIIELFKVICKPRLFTVVLDKIKKDQLRDKLTHWYDDKTIKTLQFLDNDETEVLQSTLCLLDLFQNIFNLYHNQNSKISQNDVIDLIGGFVKVFLKDWLRLSVVTKLGIPQEIIPENPNLQKPAPDIDFRYLTASSLDLLNQLTQDFLTKSIISQLFPNNISQEFFAHIRFIIRHTGCKVARWDPSKASTTKKIINDFSTISFGDSKVDFSYLNKKPIRRHLFSQDALHLSIEKIVQTLLFGAEEKISLSPSAGSDADSWQSIFHCLANLIDVPLPEDVDFKGWLRYLSAVTKQGRCPINRKIASLLFSNMCQESKFPEISDQIIKLLKDYHIDHHEGNDIQLIALTFNVLYDAKQRGLNLDKISYIWKQSISLIERQTDLDYGRLGHLYILLKEAMETDPDSFDTIIAFLQISAFLKAHTPNEPTNELKVYLIEHEGEAALQIVDGPALLLNTDLLMALDVLSHVTEESCNKILPFLFPILSLFTSTEPSYKISSQISRNLNHFPTNFINLLTEKNFELLCKEGTPCLIKKLCFHLLLSLHSLDPSNQLTLGILEYFPEMLNLEIDPFVQKQLVIRLKTLLKNSSFASIDNSTLFDRITQAAIIETSSQEHISVEWTQGLVATLDPQLSQLAITIWRKITFGFLIPLQKNSGTAIFTSLLKISLQEAFLFFRHLQECECLTIDEEFQTFSESLDMKGITENTNAPAILITLEKILSSILTKFEKQNEYTKPSTKIATLIHYLVDHQPTEENLFNLVQATRFKIIPNTILNTINHLFSKHPLQAILLFHIIHSEGDLKNEEAIPFFQKLLKNRPQELSTQTLLAIKNVYVSLAEGNYHTSAKTGKNSKPLQFGPDFIWCLKALIEMNLLNGASDLLALNIQQTEEIKQLTQKYLEMELSLSHDLSLCESLEKSLILSKEQKLFLDLDKLKLYCSKGQWDQALPLLNQLINDCKKSSQKQLLILSLKQIFEKIPAHEVLFTSKIKALLSDPNFNLLFEDMEQTINFLLEYEEVFRNCHYFLRITFIQTVLKNLSRLKTDPVSPETSSRLARFFIRTLEHPGPLESVLKAVEQKLKQTLPNLIAIFSLEIGPHLFDLCLVLKQFSLHKIEIQIPFKLIGPLLFVVSKVLENFSGDLSQLELIHDLFDSLKLYGHKTPSLPNDQIRTYTLLIERLVQHKSQHANKWIARKLHLLSKSNDVKELLQVINYFDLNVNSLSPEEQKQHARSIYHQIYHLFLTDEKCYEKYSYETIVLMANSGKFHHFFLENTTSLTEKLLASSPQDEKAAIHLLNVTTYMLQNLRLCITDSHPNPKLIERFIFVPYVHHKDCTAKSFKTHLNCVRLILNAITTMPPEYHGIYQNTILLCKAYLGDTTFAEMLIKNPERKTTVESMITKLINPSLPHCLIHFILNSSAFKLNSQNSFDFSGCYTPLLLANSPKTGLPIFIEIPKLLLNLSLDNTELTNCAHHFLNVVSEIYIKMDKDGTPPPKMLLVIRDLLLHLFLHGLVKTEYERFYDILDNLMPCFLKALLDEKHDFYEQDAKYNLNNFFPEYDTSSKDEKKRKGASFYKWLTAYLLPSRDPRAMTSAREVLTECTPKKALFLALPPNMQEAVTKRTQVAVQKKNAN